MSIKETITHMGRTQEGCNLYLRKNKTGQWCTIRPNRKGYRWDMINYLSEYPVDVWGGDTRGFERSFVLL